MRNAEQLVAYYESHFKQSFLKFNRIISNKINCFDLIAIVLTMKVTEYEFQCSDNSYSKIT